MNYTRLYMIRHGQVAGHDVPRFNGQTDVDLSPLGRAQLDAVAEDLLSVDLAAVYSSDLQRARYGGEALARSRNMPLRMKPLLRERHFGKWESLSFDEVRAQYPGVLEERKYATVDFKAPEGETIPDMWRRVEKGLAEILSENSGSAVALVAHSGVNRIIILQALGGSLRTILENRPELRLPEYHRLLR